MGDMEYIQQEEVLPADVSTATLYITATNQNYQFKAEILDELPQSQSIQCIDFGNASAKYLTSEVAGGFTGVMIGIYAVDSLEDWVRFTEFCYKPQTV